MLHRQRKTFAVPPQRGYSTRFTLARRVEELISRVDLLDAFIDKPLARTYFHARERAFGAVGAVLVAVAGLLFSVASHAQAQTPPPPPSPADKSQTSRAEIAQTKEIWRTSMKRLVPPHKGCFKSEYPRVEWLEIQCVAAPKEPKDPHFPARKPGSGAPVPATVGNNQDYAAQVSGHITSAEGSFDSVSGVTSETDSLAGANQNSLQINTNFFSTPVCGAGNTGCNGWQQFVYDPGKGQGYIQYWMTNYGATGTTCPANWITTPLYGAVYCYRNSNTATPIPVQTIADLANFKLTGTVNSNGTDTITLDTGSTQLSLNQTSLFSLGSVWNVAEFNIFGYGNSSEADFNNGATVVVRTSVTDGTTNAPTCIGGPGTTNGGFTAETNNLTLLAPCCTRGGASPSIAFKQSNAAGMTSSCLAGGSVGDTHLTTFSGLLYDFQASGDFVLAEQGSDFVVQTRQRSGAPNWPNAAVNNAVATRMGRDKVALCLLPTRLQANGRRAEVRDGASISLANGAKVSRNGNVYVISDKAGDSVTATLYDYWMDVAVGVSNESEKVRGLLGNPGKPEQIAMRDGTVLNEPVSFETLYRRFGESWRVPAADSMICKDREVEHGNPQKPFYAKDLEGRVREVAERICKEAGVTGEANFEACVLDVAVTGKKEAAKAFVNKPAPIAVWNFAHH